MAWSFRENWETAGIDNCFGKIWNKISSRCGCQAIQVTEDKKNQFSFTMWAQTYVVRLCTTHLNLLSKLRDPVCFETGSHWVALAVLELGYENQAAFRFIEIHLPLAPGYLDERHAPLNSAIYF